MRQLARDVADYEDGGVLGEPLPILRRRGGRLAQVVGLLLQQFDEQVRAGPFLDPREVVLDPRAAPFAALAQEGVAQEVDGFRLFAGKGGCANCHAGWAFTDYAFYDVGLESEDRGRGAVLRIEKAEHAFKTPSLREAARRAPYMHDGSLATLKDVVRHYAGGIVDRPTLPPDLRRISLSESEQAALVAFLKTLSLEGDPLPPARIVAEQSQALPGEHVTSISQHDKMFTPTRVQVKPGERLWLLNNDTRTHNVRVFDEKLDFDSGAQEPGETVELAFPKVGNYLVFCGIHHKMELTVDVR